MVTLLDISEVCSMIQGLNSYKLLTDKMNEKVPWITYRPDEKKTKIVSESQKLTFHKGQH